MTLQAIYIIGGALLMAMGVSILIFRAPYAAWWNRIYARRRQPQNFTATLSIVYGLAAVAIGAFLLVVLGIL